MNNIVGAVFILTCSAIIAAAAMFLTYGSGISDNAQYVIVWCIATVLAVIACRLP